MPSHQNQDLTEEVAGFLAHFSFCALVALNLARQDGRAGNTVSDHLFLMRWLEGAQRQKRFPREVAAEMLLLQRLGKKNGPPANLPKKLQHLWEICTGIRPQLSDVALLNTAIAQLKENGWLNELLSQAEWRQGIPTDIVHSGINAILAERLAIESAFSKNGMLMSPLEFLICGDAAAAINAFTDVSLTLSSTSEPQKFQLLPPVAAIKTA
ncbi:MULTISPECIES: DUF2913 family protein [Sodalis]|uniref:DUF2913 family protein n=1 Tax=Sodalis ligni TaxID=2697027 RepID=A0A4R1N9K1_9GAMM|nr:DUF2913 family protein [Sodalis ligni]TCL02201.1 DUF2913 family protein [Sodalis ligni]